jgi:hypothetical protein
MRRIALAVAVLIVAVALAVLTPRLVAGDSPGCYSINFSRDCAPTNALPYPATPNVPAHVNP